MHTDKNNPTSGKFIARLFLPLGVTDNNNLKDLNEKFIIYY